MVIGSSTDVSDEQLISPRIADIQQLSLLLYCGSRNWTFMRSGTIEKKQMFVDLDVAM